MKLSPEKSWLYQILFHGLVHTIDINKSALVFFYLIKLSVFGSWLNNCYGTKIYN